MGRGKQTTIDLLYWAEQITRHTALEVSMVVPASLHATMPLHCL